MINSLSQQLGLPARRKAHFREVRGSRGAATASSGGALSIHPRVRVRRPRAPLEHSGEVAMEPLARDVQYDRAGCDELVESSPIGVELLPGSRAHDRRTRSRDRYSGPGEVDSGRPPVRQRDHVLRYRAGDSCQHVPDRNRDSGSSIAARPSARSKARAARVAPRRPARAATRASRSCWSTRYSRSRPVDDRHRRHSVEPGRHVPGGVHVGVVQRTPSRTTISDGSTGVWWIRTPWRGRRRWGGAAITCTGSAKLAACSTRGGRRPKGRRWRRARNHSPAA